MYLQQRPLRPTYWTVRARGDKSYTCRKIAFDGQYQSRMPPRRRPGFLLNRRQRLPAGVWASSVGPTSRESTIGPHPIDNQILAEIQEENFAFLDPLSNISIAIVVDAGTQHRRHAGTAPFQNTFARARTKVTCAEKLTLTLRISPVGTSVDGIDGCHLHSLGRITRTSSVSFDVMISILQVRGRVGVKSHARIFSTAHRSESCHAEDEAGIDVALSGSVDAGSAGW